ncbi:MAG: hypothetical protein Q8Q89_01365 [bacterium]|nr:hypothetical protein [bacterium]
MRPLVELALSDSRKRLKSLLDKIFEQVSDPEMNLDTALDLGLITYGDLAKLYDDLSDFVANKDNARIILYLPFEILPSLNKPITDSRLERQRIRFASFYLTAWRNLLFSNENDLRTNFIDGDVWEPELGENPRVRKAAHLIPELIERGFLSISEVYAILVNSTEDKVLQESLLDVLPILADKNLITNKVAVRTKFTRKPIPENPSRALLARIAWDKQEKLNQKIKEGAAKFIKEISKTKRIEPENAKYFLEPLTKFWQNSSIEIRDELVSVLSHWFYFGIVNENDLKLFGLKKPNLESPSDKEAADEIEGIIEKIRNNEKLSQILYPIGIAFGSRIKGYGKLSADLDIAVFVRPDVSWNDRKTIYENLGKVTEFWLKECGELIEVREVPLEYNNIAEKDWVHILLQGIWFGKDSEIVALRQKLLPRYLTSTDENERIMWIRQLELEALQYRLMHKGYARFYPLLSRAQTEHSYLIDSDSAFWDPGYRRLATKLFITRVFLPQINDFKK